MANLIILFWLVPAPKAPFPYGVEGAQDSLGALQVWIRPSGNGGGEKGSAHAPLTCTLETKKETIFLANLINNAFA